MDTESIIYIVAAGLILRTIVKVILRFTRDQKAENSDEAKADNV